MKLEAPAAAGTPVPEQQSPVYTIVTQVKSNRVVYFTDDPDYAPPMDGDWYYISSYPGALPAEMSLRNCWRWRFNGGVFTDTKSSHTAPAAKKLPLVEHNRKVLLQILNEKIDTIRSQQTPSCIMGAFVREEKAREARAFLTGQAGDAQYPFLEAVAVARNIPLADAAHLILDRAAVTATVLAETERLREHYARAILAAPDAEGLLALRERLLDDVYPHLTERFAFKVQKTEPIDPDQPLDATHLRHEQVRLQVQLREKINARRAEWMSQYALDDVILKHKGVLAERVVANNGRKPENGDFSVLETYAQARGVSLLDAAKDVLKELSELGRVLAETEKRKDTLMAEIAAVRSLKDIRGASARIASLFTS